MADAVERVTKFRDAALVLAEDLADGSKRMQKAIRGGEYVKARQIAENVQRAARDTKWLMDRLPKD